MLPSNSSLLPTLWRSCFCTNCGSFLSLNLQSVYFFPSWLSFHLVLVFVSLKQDAFNPTQLCTYITTLPLCCYVILHWSLISSVPLTNMLQLPYTRLLTFYKTSKLLKLLTFTALRPSGMLNMFDASGAALKVFTCVGKQQGCDGIVVCLFFFFQGHRYPRG